MNAPAEVLANAFLPVDLAQHVASVEERVDNARELAASIVVESDDDAAKASKLLIALARQDKDAEAKRRELVKPREGAVKEINRAFKEAAAPYKELQTGLRTKVQAWTELQEQRQREEQERLDREAEEREAKLRAEREAEEKAKREAAERAQREAREAEELAAEDPEYEELVDETRDTAEAARLDAAATEALPDPIVPRAHVAPAANPSGISTPKRWVAEVTDIAKVPDFLPDGTPLKVVMTAALNRYMHDTIKATGKPPEMPGAKFEQKAGLAVRG
jgi:hypothetical protein